MSSSSSNMGDLFRQRRAAAASAAQPSPPTATAGGSSGETKPTSSAAASGTASNKPSFLEIQQEQERSMQQEQSAARGRGVMSGGGGPNHRASAAATDGANAGSRRGGRGGGSGNGGRSPPRPSGSGNSGRSPPRNSGSANSNSDRTGSGGGAGGSGSSNNRNSNNRSSRGSSQRGGGNTDPTLRYPLEQGRVVSLKDNYGFIQCADRDEQVFFHYSEVVGGVDALHVNDEVDFRIGPTPRDADKMAAYKVTALPAGTKIQWEVPAYNGQRMQGLVVRPPHSALNRNSYNSGSGGETNEEDGTIRLLLEPRDGSESAKGTGAGGKEANDDGATPADAKTKQPEGPVVRFGLADYTVSTTLTDDKQQNRVGRSGQKGSSSSLKSGDLVEFRVVTKKPTMQLVARDVTLILSERDRLQQETERRLMQSAVLEHGVVTMLNSESGFLRSSSRRDKIFFHYSSIDLDDDNLVLEEGQDMKFLVVEEEENSGGGGSGGGRQRRYSARRVQVQPRGSVVFHDALVHGVTGTVTLVPQCVDSSHLLEQHGKIRLDQPITAKRYNDNGEPEGDETIQVNEVFLSTDDSPGGRFPFRGGSSVGLWIQVGDKLLFDIVQDYSDGACRAVPTRHLTPLAMKDSSPSSEVDHDDGDVVPAVRLIDLTLAGRAEGVIGALKEGYGFVQFAERSVDVHFKMFQILPDALQDDLRRNMGLPNVDDRGRRWELDLGVQVQFDISVQGTIPSGSNSGSGRSSRGHGPESLGQQQNERENLKAQRILVLPPDTYPQFVALATGVRGVIKKQEATQPYVGNVELDEEAKPMGLEVKHRLVAKLIQSYLDESNSSPMDVPPLAFHDVQSLKEDEVVIKLLDHIGKGKLVHAYTPQPTYPARLCIEKATENDGSNTPNEVSTPNDEGDGNTDANNAESDDKAAAKKKTDKAKPIKSVRYDKNSMGDDLRKDIPPGLEDVVEVDVLQCRRTGRLLIENMRIVERCAATTAVSETSAMGIVKEVVPARNFGFVSVIDESSSMSEMLFFQMKTDSADGSDAGKKGPKFRKGDVVKFAIAVEKNGKRTAVNVVLCPKNELRSQADKNACLGIILAKPSQALGKHTPLRKTTAAAAATTPSTTPKNDKTGRWDTIDEDRKKSGTEDPITEPGYVLLTHDPLGLFASRTTDGDVVAVGDNEEAKTDEIRKNETDNAVSTTALDADSKMPLCLRYKTGGLAFSGTGSSSAGDDSTHPRRGDLVSFVKSTKNSGGAFVVRDMRIVTREVATLIRGQLKNVKLDSADIDGSGKEKGTATFVPDSAGSNGDGSVAVEAAATATAAAAASYEIDLADLVGCEPSSVKENEAVEGILHEGQVYGVARTADLYFGSSGQSKLPGSTTRNKERTKLNLTVKKDLGGKIVAQSMMAKGPDGTNGFATGWTSRPSRFPTTMSELKVDAPEFTPAAAISAPVTPS